jgi:heme-binding protein
LEADEINRAIVTGQGEGDFMTSLKALSREQVASKVKGYMASHPDEQADMAGIRQPLVDIKDRCGAPPSP